MFSSSHLQQIYSCWSLAFILQSHYMKGTDCCFPIDPFISQGGKTLLLEIHPHSRYEHHIESLSRLPVSVLLMGAA
jgi:hypothetical protein